MALAAKEAIFHEIVANGNQYVGVYTLGIGASVRDLLLKGSGVTDAVVPNDSQKARPCDPFPGNLVGQMGSSLFIYK